MDSHSTRRFGVFKVSQTDRIMAELRSAEAEIARLNHENATLEDEGRMLRTALWEIVSAEPKETPSGTAWPSFAGRLQNIAGAALSRDKG